MAHWSTSRGLTAWDRFRQDTRGSITVEFVIMIPIIFWAFMALYVFFDGYRQSSINLKAAYTISDVLSRETGYVDDDYIDAMQSLFQFLTLDGSETGLRISVLRWDQDDEEYFVDWSTERDWPSATIWTDANINTIDDQLPVMSDGERLILVETHNTYEPIFNVGLGTQNLESFVFTSPRFVEQVVWDD